jgi:hypothetical protein
MIVFDRRNLGQDSSNVPLVTVIEPMGSSVSAKKEYLLFGDKYITVKVQITNTTQFVAFNLTYNWQAQGGSPQTKTLAFPLNSGETTTISTDLVISNTPANVAVQGFIVAMYTPTQPVSEPARVVDLQLAVG